MGHVQVMFSGELNRNRKKGPQTGGHMYEQILETESAQWWLGWSPKDGGLDLYGKIPLACLCTAGLG